MMALRLPRVYSFRLSRQAPIGVIRNMSTPSNHPNPGNFANRPREEVSEIGRKGGSKGGKARGVGGFHNMDPEKQAWFPPPCNDCRIRHTDLSKTVYSALSHPKEDTHQEAHFKKEANEPGRPVAKVVVPVAAYLHLHPWSRLLMRNSVCREMQRIA